MSLFFWQKLLFIELQSNLGIGVLFQIKNLWLINSTSSHFLWDKFLFNSGINSHLPLKWINVNLSQGKKVHSGKSNTCFILTFNWVNKKRGNGNAFPFKQKDISSWQCWKLQEYNAFLEECYKVASSPVQTLGNYFQLMTSSPVPARRDTRLEHNTLNKIK